MNTRQNAFETWLIQEAINHRNGEYAQSDMSFLKGARKVWYEIVEPMLAEIEGWEGRPKLSSRPVTKAELRDLLSAVDQKLGFKGEVE